MCGRPSEPDGPDWRGATAQSGGSTLREASPLCLLFSVPPCGGCGDRHSGTGDHSTASRPPSTAAAGVTSAPCVPHLAPLRCPLHKLLNWAAPQGPPLGVAFYLKTSSPKFTWSPVWASALPASHPLTSQVAQQDRGGGRTQLCKHLSCFDSGNTEGGGQT